MTSTFEISQETAEAINYIANYESKAVAYLGLAAIREGTIIDLSNEVSQHVGIAACRRVVEGFPRVFADKGFATVQQRMGRKGRFVRYYAVARQEVALPPIGTLLEWSDLHDYPLIVALSSPAGSSSGGPMNTIQICEGLLQNKRIREMGLPGYKLYHGFCTAHNSRLGSLVKAGLIQAIDDPNDFLILNPTYRGDKPFASLTPERQAVYLALDRAKQIAPTARWTMGQIVAIAREQRLIEDTFLPTFKKLLVEAVSARSPKRFVGAVAKIDVKPREYVLNPHYRTMIADLVTRVVKVGTEARYAADMREYAMSVYHDVPTAARIMQRGLDNSPYLHA